MAVTVTWTGVSGEKYDTNLCQFGIPFTKGAGVYIFCKESASKPGWWDQIYVGECEDFNDRLNLNLAQHHRLACIRREGATHVCAIDVAGGKQARVNVETDLRKSLDPPCNRQ
jgi:hypothetical protein